ncbi:DoxX family membrane protein [Paenibacillus doosanensis]|uniref:DoxX n=1 Tax=Paenibacillus konkukensis TaxID=2020716 RepID=A0ABY4RH71_9BACL|nr:MULTISPECIES: DoxX family membrane protein [Paenibacillus]MCS7459864.1 DoxX family membrane protein [Paenibacillus doosanensis]UQZ81717.1 DoxX [Paenibacillus konkukensis]
MNSVNYQGRNVIIPENPVSRFLLSDTRAAWIWLIIRVYVGYEWLVAGWHKVTADAWVGAKGGTALQGFVKGALTKAESGADVTGWYASFLQNVVLPNAKVFAYMVAYGEILVGLGLILGLLTGIAAFFGGLMNASYLFAGTLSTNPLLFVLATWLVLAWKVAGWYGLDRWALRYLGTPWHAKSSTSMKL